MPKPYTPNDRWSRRAAEDGYRARSVYKLMELDERFTLLAPGMTVLDCGAAPGSWLQYAARRVGPRGRVIGVDREPIVPVAEHVSTVQEDITDVHAVRSALEELGVSAVDIVLSDLAPNTSGVHDVDQWHSIELGQAVVTLAEALLKPGGTCVLKVLRGGDFDEWYSALKRTWQHVKTARVEATRDRSSEVYVIMRFPLPPSPSPSQRGCSER